MTVKLIPCLTPLLALLASCAHSLDVPEHYVERAIDRYGSGSVEGLTIVVDVPWRLRCGGSCIHYDDRLIEVARGERWRQDVMHEVTHWLLYQDGHPPGTHHPIMHGRGICYGGCGDVPMIGSDRGDGAAAPTACMFSRSTDAGPTTFSALGDGERGEPSDPQPVPGT
jgi:hypothetical protein